MHRTGKYYEPGERRADRVEELFSRIAPRYDLINDLQSFGLHRVWKRRLVHLAQVPAGGSALDLCCGTGDIVSSLARAYPLASLIAGLDFAMPMLEIAMARGDEAPPPAMNPATGAAGRVIGQVPRGDGLRDVAPASGGAGGLNAGWRGDVSNGQGRGSDQGGTSPGSAAKGGRPDRVTRSGPRIVYLRADALAIPARDGSFDRVTISYGLRNVSDLRRCLAEVRRVLRPEGRCLVLDFGKPENPIIARAYFAYLRLGVPLFGRLFFGDPDTHRYILDSLLHFPSQKDTAALLRECGFSKVRYECPLLGVMGLHVADL